jgi:hypothetical protein
VIDLSDFSIQLSDRQKRLLQVFVVLKLALLTLACFTPFTHPHIVRQTDTMSVALRYYLRFFVEEDGHHHFLPALLSAGDQYGLAPMEFPVLNLLFSPVFALPMPYALYCAQLALTALCLGLVLWHHKVWCRALLQQTDAASAILPIKTASIMIAFFSVSSIYLNRFMPDFTAFLLVSLSAAYSWNRYDIKSPLLLALGTLIKPPAVVALVIYLLKPNLIAQLRHAIWVLPALALTAAYYTLGLDFVSSLSDMKPYFKVDARDPIEGIKGFVTRPKDVLDIFNSSVFTKYLAVPNLALSMHWIQKKVNPHLHMKLWLVLGLQMLLVVFLDGTHSFHHHYYFAGVSMTATLITLFNLQGAHRLVKWAFVLVFVITSLEFSWYGVRSLFRSKPTMLSQCMSLKRSQPQFPWGQAYRFRSPQVNPPELGMCFGEIQGSETSEFGFWKVKGLSKLPKDCAVIERAKDVALIRCAGPVRPHE